MAAEDTAAGEDPTLRVRRPATSLLTFGTAALVLVIVVVLVVIKVTGTSTVSTSSNPAPPSQAPPSVAQAVTHIPASVYADVGTTSSVASVKPPSLLHGQPELSARRKPEILFVGEEFSPYAAAERWALVAALSRFGTFTTLNAMQSAGGEAFSGTPTFTFYGSRYKSRYVSTALVERFSDQKNGAGTGFAPLQHLTHAERTVVARYDHATLGTSGPLLPFLDIANHAVLVGGGYSPSIFQELSANAIATGLTDATDPVTQAIVAEANYLSAVICLVDGGHPAKVCSGPGVVSAAAALGVAP